MNDLDRLTDDLIGAGLIGAGKRTAAEEYARRLHAKGWRPGGAEADPGTTGGPKRSWLGNVRTREQGDDAA